MRGLRLHSGGLVSPYGTRRKPINHQSAVVAGLTREGWKNKCELSGGKVEGNAKWLSQHLRLGYELCTRSLKGIWDRFEKEEFANAIDEMLKLQATKREMRAAKTLKEILRSYPHVCECLSALGLQGIPLSPVQKPVTVPRIAVRLTSFSRLCRFCGHDGMRKDFIFCPFCGKRI